MKKHQSTNHRARSLVSRVLLTALLTLAFAIQAIADEAVNLDADGSAADFFNPYTFARGPLWILLPIFALIILGLHLMPVPKRRPKNKIDQGKRFFNEISGEDKK